MPNGGNKQWWWRVQRIHLARNGIVWNWCPNLINQFLENHRCSKKQRNLCLQLVHHCFHDVCIGYCIYRLLAHLAIRIARRSEEHTSELQSRPHLVCRLLLEKKKKKKNKRLYK